MHDYVATFYGGYDQIGLRRAARMRPSAMAIAIGVAATALLVLVAADASAYAARPAIVQVTGVDWYGPGAILLLTSGGFRLTASATTTFSLTCDPTTSICLPWNGATVSAPFSLVRFSAVAGPTDYTNLTIRAPASAYTGPLAITLGLPDL